jgi:hypothetical protein
MPGSFGPGPEHVAGLNRLPLKDCINQTESEASDRYEQHFSIWNGHCFQKILPVSAFFTAPGPEFCGELPGHQTSDAGGKSNHGNYPHFDGLESV